jgi:hypothetical protein
MNIYLELTKAFNQGRLRCVISSGQAVVLHRLAIMSKDGDWILKEDQEALDFVLKVLSSYGAKYRLGAPLDLRWLRHGWSSHFEFPHNGLRVRTDFVSRPPRLDETELNRLWQGALNQDPPFVSLPHLAELKKTNREKDFAVIGELARLMPDPRHRFLYSRSARDLIALAAENPELSTDLQTRRPVLRAISDGREKLEEALDGERREMMHANEKRLEKYQLSAQQWAAAWPGMEKNLAGKPLLQAHATLIKQAQGSLPFKLEEEGK